ncbi:LARGE xylosyl- and glucuronyltransferase 2 [Psilocybe cubensis]|uniref:LARGE xylosyl- and glucuronyltransferase 2 n=1 Tax=Psilocybe cubensis TaxID=181762 RepID=A0ACB8HCU5_PSICU|nr:LARGE xylosyl- and glucuronyltransferase 2 [Psilocybe cubensis]KAH9485472.1 LARGE xylosyl- and glucuronyltransferase 2 [Psilocybe cubensis]
MYPDFLSDRAGSAFSWESSKFTLENGLGHSDSVYVDEKLVLSKVFANSMRPSNIRPYFYRAKGSFEKDDITITTLITSNRFKVFARLVEKYRGPISVTVHVKDVAEHVEAVLESLRDMYISSQTMMTFVDVHLVVDAFDRQFNTWRNIARLFARTDFVMMLDIDFYPCTDFRSVIRRSSTISDKLYAGRAALVVPAFEYVDFHEGTNYAAFPTKKMDLLHLVNNHRIDMFHASWAPGHNSTDYNHFYSAPSGEVYKVTRYQSAYEPYVIFKKDGPPWCDERFVGYGGNKAACLFEMYLAGVSFYVLADHFIVHQNHLYEENARKNERRRNRKLYADFKEESCLRYLKSYHDLNMLRSDLAENALAECRKLKSVVRAVPKYFQSHTEGVIP